MAGVACWRIRKGTLPGHTIGGDIFLGAYGGALDRYLEKKDREWEQINYRDTRVDMSITTFVDDIGEFMIANDCTTLHRKAMINTQLLVEELQQIGGNLEPTKEMVVPRMMGRNAHRETTQASIHGQLTDGTKTACARYLGAWPQMSGGIQVDIAKHRTAMKTGFYAFQGVWGSSKVSLRIKKLFFTAIVLSAGLSGLEPYFLLESDYRKLESTRMALLRRIFGREGWGATQTSRAHSSVPDIKVRRWAGMHSIASVLRRRRLQWLKNMLKCEQYHVQ